MEQSKTEHPDEFRFITPDPAPQKWILKSGTVVEDLLRANNSELESFRVIDTKNQQTRLLFSSEDWQEVTSALPKLPEPSFPPLDELERNPTIQSEMKKHDSLTDIKKLRLLGMAAGLANDENEWGWLAHAILTLCHLYRETDGKTFLRCSHGEKSYDFIWSSLLDAAVSEAFYMSRGELESLSLKEFLNAGRTVEDRVRDAPRHDGVIKSYSTDTGSKSIEYGFVEAWKEPPKSYASKLLEDKRKLLKSMAAALHLSPKAKMRVSLQVAELEMRIVYMVRGGGTVLLGAHRPLVRLADTFNLASISKVLHEVSLFRSMLRSIDVKAESDDGRNGQFATLFRNFGADADSGVGGEEVDGSVVAHLEVGEASDGELIFDAEADLLGDVGGLCT